MADKNTTSNINLAAAEELPKAQSKFKEFVKKFMKRKTAYSGPLHQQETSEKASGPPRGAGPACGGRGPTAGIASAGRSAGA